MKVRDISRTTVEVYLRLIRLPVDAVIDRLPGNGSGAAPTARLVVDRADASVRARLASILGDSLLREDAQRRANATEKRERALRLREEADRKTGDADARLEQSQAQAERRRQQAQQQARSQREQAEQQRQDKAKRAAATERKRLEASRKATARTEQAVDKRARKDRLETIETKTSSLREKEQALAAKDEARRLLGDAAARAKAQRKNGNG